MTGTKSAIRRASGEESHIRAIEFRIATIKREIGDEMKRPAPDFLRVSKLKRQKLHLKDKVRRAPMVRMSAKTRRPLGANAPAGLDAHYE